MMKNVELIKKIEENIYTKIHHPFLKGYTPKTTMDQDKLAFFVRAFSQANVSYEETIQYTSAIMIIQIALDTHDLIAQSTPVGHDDDIVQRQLQILAGDYYSGLYYQTLAGMSNDQMIYQLAEGIKVINELKVMRKNESLLKAEKEAIELEIKTILLVKVCEMYDNTGLLKTIISHYHEQMKEKDLVEEGRLL